uniref:Uncharacterized protein n=1 Tax=Picea sitchensis TaxID=3332 RepID=D5ABG7_PICSI|nr:unknown [Picea sitchensis]
MVKSNVDNTSVCQVLSFRGTLLGIRTLSFIVGCVNLICSFSWAVLIAFEGGTGKWYEIEAMPPSKPRIAVIIAAICIGLAMDCSELFSEKSGGSRSLVIHGRKRLMLWAVIVLETMCIVSCIAVAGVLGIKKGFGRWVYSALQGLVWVKWGTGSYLLGDYSPEHVHRPSSTTTLEPGLETLDYSSAKWVDHGSLVYSSAFLLNAVLAGVRGKWN